MPPSIHMSHKASGGGTPRRRPRPPGPRPSCAWLTPSVLAVRPRGPGEMGRGVLAAGRAGQHPSPYCSAALREQELAGLREDRQVAPWPFTLPPTP